MLADFDLLLTTVFVVADDLLPAAGGNAKRKLTDAEVITLLVAQSIRGITSDRRFVREAKAQLVSAFPGLVGQSGLHKRRQRLGAKIELVMAALARECPGFWDDVVLVDSTPVETARSRETVKRGGFSSLGDAIGNAAAYGYCASHSRWFYGMRLHGIFGLDGTPRALMLLGADAPERETALKMLPSALHGTPATVIADKGYAGAQFEADAASLGAQIVRPRRADEPGKGPRLAPIRQRVESIFWTCKDLLTLERHGARTLDNLRARIAQRMLTLTACIYLNHWLGRPTRALADYTA